MPDSLLSSRAQCLWFQFGCCYMCSVQLFLIFLHIQKVKDNKANCSSAQTEIEYDCLTTGKALGISNPNIS